MKKTALLLIGTCVAVMLVALSPFIVVAHRESRARLAFGRVVAAGGSVCYDNLDAGIRFSAGRPSGFFESCTCYQPDLYTGHLSFAEQCALAPDIAAIANSGRKTRVEFTNIPAMTKFYEETKDNALRGCFIEFEVIADHWCFLIVSCR